MPPKFSQKQLPSGSHISFHTLSQTLIPGTLESSHQGLSEGMGGSHLESMHAACWSRRHPATGQPCMGAPNLTSPKGGPPKLGLKLKWGISTLTIPKPSTMHP